MKLISKKFVNILGITAFLILNVNIANAITPVSSNADQVKLESAEARIPAKEMNIINRVNLKNKLKRTPEAQIKNFIKKYNKYSESNKLDKLKNMYSDSYVNNDGFDKETLFKLIQEAADLYKDLKYTSDIQDIKVSGTNATVKVHEKAQGETLKVVERFNDTGLITSELNYTNYLRKEDGKWKILASDITSEKVTLQYGEAKKADFEISAPEYIGAGKDYEVSVKANINAPSAVEQAKSIDKESKGEDNEVLLETVSPDGVFMFGSITNEKITYPQDHGEDVLRGLKSNELARIITSNTDNCNEYATASLGITRAHVDPASVVIDMTGMAILMTRVNVLTIKDIAKNEKESKNDKNSAK